MKTSEGNTPTTPFLVPQATDHVQPRSRDHGVQFDKSEGDVGFHGIYDDATSLRRNNDSSGKIVEHIRKEEKNDPEDNESRSKPLFCPSDREDEHKDYSSALPTRYNRGGTRALLSSTRRTIKAKRHPPILLPPCFTGSRPRQAGGEGRNRTVPGELLHSPCCGRDA
jgi:hypothetical protein